MARRCPLLLLLSLALASCGGSGPTFAKSALPRLVLQRGDAGAGFVRTDWGPIGLADTETGPREDLSRPGRKGGWKARYDRRADKSSVFSVADLFEDADAASKDLDAYRLQFADAEVEGVQVSFPVPKIGAESVGTTIAVAGRRQYRIAWRYGNVTASVDVQGPSASLKRSRAVALARRQQRRIEDAAR